MALLRVQGKGASNAGGVTTVAMTWSSNTTTGNLIVLGIEQTFGTPTSIVDSQSNTYIQIGTTTSQTNADVSLWYAKNITGGTTPTITVTTSGVSNSSIVAFEYSGADTTAPFDKTSQSIGFDTSPTSGATAATTQAAEVVVGFVGNGSSTLPTAGSGYGNLTATAGGSWSAAMEDKIVAATGAQTATFTSGFTFWGAMVATFKEATGGSAPTISKSDALTLTESLKVVIESNTARSDSITVSESINLTVIGNINKSETITTLESVLVKADLNINKSDSITFSESVSVSIISGANNITSSDSLIISENIVVVMQGVTLSVVVTPGIQNINGPRIV